MFVLVAKIEIITSMMLALDSERGWPCVNLLSSTFLNVPKPPGFETKGIQRWYID